MKKIYVLIKEKFPSEPVLYMAKYLATYAQRNSVLFLIFFHYINNGDDFG